MRSAVNLLIFLIFSFATMAQASQQWTLYLNKTKLFTSSVDSMASISLSQKDTGLITFNFSNRDTGFKRSVIIMNEKQNTLFQKELKAGCNKTSFLIENLSDKTSRQPVTVSIADIPSDPAKAALVRVAPVAICKIGWR